MSYDAYQGRRWKVIMNDDLAKCKSGDSVTFAGSAGQATIKCNEEFPYGKENGTYGEGPNTIEIDGYEIRMQITFTLKRGGASAGSWTAEDDGPWPGDG